MKQLFRVPQYPAFWASKALSDLGTGLMFALMGASMLARFDASALALAVAAYCLGGAIASPISGVLADRRSRTGIMASSDGIAAVCLIVWMIVLTQEQPSSIAALAIWALQGITGGMYEAPHRAAVPQIVKDPDTLKAANSLETLTTNVMQVGGSAAAGIVLALGHTTAGLIAAILCYAVSALCMLIIALPPVERSSTAPHPLRDFVEGCHTVGTVPWLRVTMVQIFSFFAVTFSFLYVLLQDVMQGRFGAGAIGAFFGSYFVGGAVAAVLANWILRTQPHKHVGVWACLALSCWLLPPLAVFTTMPLLVMCVAIFLASVGIGVYYTVWFTAIHLRIPGDVHGRIFSLHHSGRSLARLAGSLALPVVLAVSGHAGALLASAVVALAVALIPLLFPGVASLGAAAVTAQTPSEPTVVVPSEQCPVHSPLRKPCPVHEHPCAVHGTVSTQ